MVTCTILSLCLCVVVFSFLSHRMWLEMFILGSTPEFPFVQRCKWKPRRVGVQNSLHLGVVFWDPCFGLMQ